MPLSRQEMEQVIASGGSVLHGGRLYTKIAALPTAGDLAKGDPAQEQAVAIDLQAQIEALQAQMDALKAPAAPTTPTYDAMAESLAAAGFETAADVQAASDDELLAVPGIGQATLKKLRAELA